MADVPEVVIKWSGKEIKISGLSPSETVIDLKNAIHKETGVLPSRQKLLNLKFKGKPAGDDIQLLELKLKPKMKIMMMGTKEEELANVLEPPENLPEVLDDFDIEEEEIAIANRDVYLAKIDRRIKDYKIEIMNEPRPGKKLLVLDIDYTLFDHRSTAESAYELMRPYLHEFLTAAYENYDIVIWSATGMKWIQTKMRELGVLSNPNYKVCFMIDSLAMITVDCPKYGVVEVKPLGVIWGKFDQWSPKNTIMFDDIRRNFIMNPQSGLKIRPFKKAHFNRDKDTELIYLSKYLKNISSEDDFTTLNHKKWERYRPAKRPRLSEEEGDRQEEGSSETPTQD